MDSSGENADSSSWEQTMNQKWAIILVVTAVMVISAIAVAWKWQLDLDQTQRAEQVARDFETIQGKWVVTDTDCRNPDAPSEWFKENAIGHSITVEGDKLFLGPDSDPVSITLFPAKPFNGIDLRNSDNALHGIYELSNGRLTVCFQNKPELGRPRSMSVGSGSSSLFIELKKHNGEER